MIKNHNNDYFTILKQWKGWKVNLRNGTLLFIAWGGGGERGGFGSYQTKINPIPPKAP